MIRGVFDFGNKRPTYNVTNIYQHKCHGHNSGYGGGIMWGLLGASLFTSIAQIFTSFRRNRYSDVIGNSNPYGYLNQQFNQTTLTTNNTTQNGLEDLKKEYGKHGYEFSKVGNDWIAELNGKRLFGTSAEDLSRQLIKEINLTASNAEIVSDNDDGNDDDDGEVGNADEALKTALEGEQGVQRNETGGKVTYTINGLTVEVKDGKIKVIDNGGNNSIEVGTTYNTVADIREATKGNEASRESLDDGEHVRVTVMNGESFESIAAKYDVDIEELKTLNQDLISGHTACGDNTHEYFRVGTEIRLPASAKADEVARNKAEVKANEEISKYRSAVTTPEHIASIECDEQAKAEGVEDLYFGSTDNAGNTTENQILTTSHKDDDWKMQADQGFGNDQQFVTKSGIAYEIVDGSGDHLNQRWFTANKYEDGGDKDNKMIRFTEKRKDIELSHIENAKDNKERIPVENIAGRVYVKLDDDNKMLFEDFLQANPRMTDAEGYQYKITGVIYKLETKENGSTKLVKQ